MVESSGNENRIQIPPTPEVALFKKAIRRVQYFKASEEERTRVVIYEPPTLRLRAYSIFAGSLKDLTVDRKKVFRERRMTALDYLWTGHPMGKQISRTPMDLVLDLAEFTEYNAAKKETGDADQLPEPCGFAARAELSRFLNYLGFRVIDSNREERGERHVLYYATSSGIGESIGEFRKTPEFQQLKEQTDVHIETHAAVEELLRN